MRTRVRGVHTHKHVLLTTSDRVHGQGEQVPLQLDI